MASFELLKDRIKEHYDKLSPYYFDLWGQHIHHGYWKTGQESKELAQSQLIDELASRAGVRSKVKGLDVGCGVGGTTIHLAKKFDAKMTGITLSSTQVEMATKLARDNKVDSNVQFLQMDAEKMTFQDESFDIVWISEALSHFPNKEKFFHNAGRVLKHGGRIAIVDWFKSEHLTASEESQYIKPIEEGMLLPPISSIYDYITMLHANGFHIVSVEDISSKVSKTWDLSLDIIQNPSLWKLAVTMGLDFVNFLKSFQAMRNGYSSGKFVYGMIVAEKVVKVKAKY